jgi:dihydrofolate reductase
VKVAGQQRDLFICGGAEVYREALALGHADKLYLTKIDADFEGDTFMPEIDYSKWQLVHGEHVAVSSDFPAYSFLEYEAVR